MAGARGVDDCRLDATRELVAHDERHQRFRQKAGLEHAAAVLVGDALRLAMTDGLDDGHPHVTGGGLDGLHHGLYAVSDYDRLYFHHQASSSLDQQKKAPGLLETER